MSRRTIPFALALLLVAAAHAGSALADFFLDDFFNLENAVNAGWSWSRLERGFVVAVADLHDGMELPSFKEETVRYYRPIFLASLLLDHEIWGTRPAGYHATSILLHLVVVALFYGVLRELIPHRRTLAWFGALIYGLMPLTGMSVGWLSGRTELWPGLAMMAGIWAFLRFARTRAWRYYGLSLLAAALGLLSKENAVVFPAFASAAWMWLAPRQRPRLRLILPFVALSAGYLVLRYRVLGGFPLPPECFYYHSPDEPGFAWWFLVKSACVFFSLLTSNSLSYPIEMILYYRPWAATAMLLLAAAIAVFILRFVRGRRDSEWRRLAWFAVAWILIGMAPTAPLMVVPIYFYFPLAGVSILYLVVWEQLIERGWPRRFWQGRLRRAVPIVILVVFAGGLQLSNWLLFEGSRRSRRLVDRVAAAVDAPVDGLRIHLIEVPFWGCYMKHGLEMRWPEKRFEVHLMTMLPYLFPRVEPLSRVERLDERTLEITALGKPYWSGIAGVMAVGDRGPEKVHAGDFLEAPRYRVELREVERGGPFDRNCVRQFVFHFEDPLGSPQNLFLRFRKGTLERIEMR